MTEIENHHNRNKQDRFSLTADNGNPSSTL
jgi:hypothetical protein